MMKSARIDHPKINHTRHSSSQSREDKRLIAHTFPIWTKHSPWPTNQTESLLFYSSLAFASNPPYHTPPVLVLADFRWVFRRWMAFVHMTKTFSASSRLKTCLVRGQTTWLSLSDAIFVSAYWQTRRNLKQKNYWKDIRNTCWNLECLIPSHFTISLKSS